MKRRFPPLVERYDIDSTTLEFALINSAGPIARPVLHVLVDERSRSLVGWQVDGPAEALPPPPDANP